MYSPLTIWMNENPVDFLFVSNLTLSLFNFPSSVSILAFSLDGTRLWGAYDNVVFHRLPIFRLPLTFRLKLRRIPRTSDSMHPCYFSRVKIGRNHIWHTRRKIVHGKDSNELYISVEFKFKRKQICQMHIGWNEGCE